MFKSIPGFSRYEIDINGVVRNRRTKEVRKPTKYGTLCLTGDDRVIYNRTINSLMRDAGFIQVWIDPENNRGNQI